MTSAFVNRILMVVPILIAATTANAEAADVPASISQIKAIAGEEAQNYERLLVRASPIVRKACEQQPWAEMEKALNTAGLKPALMEDHGYYAEYRCVLLPSLSTAKGGIKMDLYLQMSVSSGRSQPTYEAPPRHTVTQALIGLSAMVGANQEQAQGTMVRRTIRHSRITRVVACYRCPICISCSGQHRVVVQAERRHRPARKWRQISHISRTPQSWRQQAT